MRIVFIDYRKIALPQFSDDLTLIAFVNTKMIEKIEKGDMNVLRTITGGVSRIKLYDSGIVLADDVSTGNFIVKKLKEIYPYINFTYLSSVSAGTLFPEMKIGEESSSHTCNLGFSCVIPNLYISNMNYASNLFLLNTMNIKAIINISPSNCPNYFEDDPKFLYLTIYEDDHPSSILKEYFDLCFRFIDANIKNCGVLVHCAAGISRSATIVISYLMKKKKLSFDDAYEFLEERHPIIDPNIGFIYQLQTYERELEEVKN